MKLRQAAGSATGSSEAAANARADVSAAVQNFPAPNAPGAPSIEPARVSARRVANDW